MGSPASAPLPGEEDSFNLQVGVRKRGSYSPAEKTWKLAQGKDRVTLREFSEMCLRTLTPEISSVLVPAIEIAFSELHGCFDGSSSFAAVLQPCRSETSVGFVLQKHTFCHFKASVFSSVHSQHNVDLQRWLKNGLWKVISNINSHYCSICQCKNIQCSQDGWVELAGLWVPN